MPGRCDNGTIGGHGRRVGSRGMERTGMSSRVVVGIEPRGEGDLPLLVKLNDPEMTEHVGGPESPEKLAERQSRHEKADSRQYKHSWDRPRSDISGRRVADPPTEHYGAAARTLRPRDGREGGTSALRCRSRGTAGDGPAGWSAAPRSRGVRPRRRHGLARGR
jgi:hypothetical protein